MNKFRCVIARSHYTDLKYGISRPFDIGDEIETNAPLDKLVTKRGGKPFVLIGAVEAPTEAEKPYEEMKVAELRSLVEELGLADDVPKDAKKDELVAFLHAVEDKDEE